MSVTPDFIGQVYKDTNTGNIWRANSTTPGDWTLEVQNMQVKWSPNNLKCGELIGFAGDADWGIDPLVGIESLTFLQETIDQFVSIADAPDLVSVSFPNLVEVKSVQNPLGAHGTWHSIRIGTWSALASFTAPLLQRVEGGINILGNGGLNSISLPSFVTATYDGIDINDSSLVDVSLPVFLPSPDTFITFANCALSVTSVNHILARAVASPLFTGPTCSIGLNGGTSAAPAGQGVTDKNTLLARGISVLTN